MDFVVFDLGQVLIGFDWRRAATAMRAYCDLPEEEIHARLLADDLLYLFETGGISGAEFHSRAEKALGIRIPFGVFRDVWNDIFTGEIAGTADLARSLLRDGRVRVAVLSNTDEWHTEYMRSTWPLLGQIPDLFLSHELGLRKPDPALFELMLRRLGAAPSRTVFIDDIAANVDAARALGINAVHATSPEQVCSELQRMLEPAFANL